MKTILSTAALLASITATPMAQAHPFVSPTRNINTPAGRRAVVNPAYLVDAHLRAANAQLNAHLGPAGAMFQTPVRMFAQGTALWSVGLAQSMLLPFGVVLPPGMYKVR